MQRTKSQKYMDLTNSKRNTWRKIQPPSSQKQSMETKVIWEHQMQLASWSKERKPTNPCTGNSLSKWQDRTIGKATGTIIYIISGKKDKINQLKAGGSGGSGQGRINKGGGKDYSSNGKDGIRVAKRLDDDIYCCLCGFNIKNTSMTC